MLARYVVTLALGLLAAAGTSCQGSCGGDGCLVYTTVSGRVTTPDGTPASDILLQSQSGRYRPDAPCDTTALQTWYDVRTDPGGRYRLTVPNGALDEVHCAFVRVIGAVEHPCNDTLVGPLTLGEFGTEPPEDTTRVDIVLQRASEAEARSALPNPRMQPRGRGGPALPSGVTSCGLNKGGVGLCGR